MSQIRVLSTHATLHFNPLNRRNITTSCLGGNALCFGGGFLTGWPSRKDLIGSSSVGLRRSEEVLLRGSLRKGTGRGGRTVCAAPAAFNPQTLHWISAVSSVVLMFAKGTPILKSFLAPLFTLQAPASLVAWLKSEYGTWTALLALLVRLFYSVPEEVELPFIAMLLTITAPSQTLNLRGTPAAAIVSLVIAGYLAYQHFSKMGGVENAFDSVSIVPTLALIAAVAVPCFLLFIY